MNCIEFETAIERAVEQRLPLEPALLEHASSCAGCQQLWELHQTIESAIVAWRFPEPPVGLADSVMESLQRPDADLAPVRVLDNLPANSPSPISRARRSQGLVVAVMTACLLITAGFIFQATRPTVFDQIVKSSNGTIRGNDPMDLPGTWTAVLSDLKSEYSEMAVETTTAAREMVSAIPRPEAVSVLPEAEEFSLQQTSGEMTRIWKPIGSQVGTALGFLWQAVPTEVPSG